MSTVEEENANVNVLKNLRDNKTKTFSITHGVGWLRDIEFDAGEEIEILVEYNWNRRGITKDWSVTAWGDTGEVTVRHSKSIRSEHFAYTPKENKHLTDPLFTKKIKAAVEEVT